MGNEKTKILITGGHAGSTGYALIEELIKNKKRKFELFWVGSETALEGKSVETFEKKVSTEIGIKFLPLFTGKLQTKFTFWTIPSLLKVPIGFIHSLYMLSKVRPDIVVSFGGYVGLPIVMAAWMLRIPSIIHEQTAVAGRGNLFASKFATKIALARRTSLHYFPRKKSVVTGNPLSSEIRMIKSKSKISDVPTILITGGSRGSNILNETTFRILDKLLLRYQIIHLVGDLQYEYGLQVREKLPKSLKNNYTVVGFAMPWQMRDYLEKSDIIIGRAGANTVAEIMFIKRPSILIPLKIANKNEQLKNAEIARDFGIAVIIDQNELNPESLLNEIGKIRRNWGDIVNSVKNSPSPDSNATEALTDLIFKTAN